MIHFELLVAYFFAVIVLIITPGPVVALVLKNALIWVLEQDSSQYLEQILPHSYSFLLLL
ncbi:hypothetical protein OQH60_06120 [Campylobacter sp. MIT 21-1685]|uniref:hypothetical protein n=1 Tax=unclassified Campylobacter TaxID=2593542 RepID=UPI00224AC6F0|nr:MULTISPECIES: hypothetical protein [unclassified Campylobacter]MCX2683458.1 hypothetical protein [Campylobacter sp. MIT 21-1684]MCX2751720.1 hypothetical protein [Campylobacter sp. MIT 21-1682]MCX2807922.1 hypothetical protein [Campylobacter sp. MIT 21-1685]